MSILYHILGYISITFHRNIRHFPTKYVEQIKTVPGVHNLNTPIVISKIPDNIDQIFSGSLQILLILIPI